jgi:hypothetical protein
MAQYNLGVMYNNGRGVPKDEAQAVVWYRKAAEQGYAAAQNNLGVMYSAGLGGLEASDTWAVYWQALAAQQGNDNAIKNLEKNVRFLPALRVRSTANIRAQSNAQGRVVGQAKAGDVLYKLGSVDEWVTIYRPTGHLVGFVSASLVSEQRPAAASSSATPRPAAAPPAADDGFPARPAKEPGVVKCNTRCYNGDCKRTYDDGRKVRFQAQRRFNSMTNEWEWDSGGC